MPQRGCDRVADLVPATADAVGRTTELRAADLVAGALVGTTKQNLHSARERVTFGNKGLYPSPPLDEAPGAVVSA